MVLLACLEAVTLAALVAVVYLLLRRQAQIEAAHARADAASVAERRELLNRIQRPEHTPIAVPADFVVPEPEPDEIDLVGTIADPGLEE